MKLKKLKDNGHAIRYSSKRIFRKKEYCPLTFRTVEDRRSALPLS